MNNMRNKILMTLALLLTAVTGAWAGEEPQLLTTITFDVNGPVYSESGIVTLSSTGSGISSAGIYYILPSSPAETMVATVDVATGKDVSKVVFYGYDGNDFVSPLEDTEAPYVCYANAGGGVRSLSSDLSNSVGSHRIGKIEVYGHAEPAIDVKWDAANKTGNFVMPAFDVEIAPIYAPVAQWAKVENMDQLPTIIEGVYAGTTDAIVKAGTVATTKIGEADPIAQGTVMYAVTTENKKPTSTTGFSATVPTGAALTGSFAEDQTVYVWYYIAGIDAAEGVTPTAENTFNDSEICTTPLTITLKANQFDLNITPAPVSNATVTVAGTAATAEQLNTGKIEKVGTSSEIKLKANEGYKFRKVEVKKTPKQ